MSKLKESIATATAEQLDDPVFKEAVIKEASFQPLQLELDRLSNEVTDFGHDEVRVTYRLPFTGSGALLHSAPSRRLSVPPDATFTHGTTWGRDEQRDISFSTESSTYRPEDVRAWRDKFIETLTKWVTFANNDARTHNELVERTFDQEVEGRRRTIKSVDDFKNQL